jgi:hypothetical protein
MNTLKWQNLRKAARQSGLEDWLRSLHAKVSASLILPFGLGLHICPFQGFLLSVEITKYKSS